MQTSAKRLSVSAAAERLGVTCDRVRRLIKAGEMPGVLNVAVSPAGRPRYLIPVTTLDAFEARRAVEVT